jgi:hypothetical protein
MSGSWTMPDPAEMRSDEARRLIEESTPAGALVELVIMYGLELCVLDGPRQVLFDEAVARAWGSLDDDAREAAISVVTQDLVDRGLLLGPGAADTYAVSPELGLVLAAKTRPAFAVLTQIEGAEVRTMKMYALGDETEPMQAMVAELPEAAPPGDFPHVRKLGVFAWFYRYVLLSPETAANVLATWAIAPPPPSRKKLSRRRPERIVSIFSHRPGQDLRRLDVTVRGDGQTARLSRDGRPQPGPGVDEAGLRQAMIDLFSAGLR